MDGNYSTSDIDEDRNSTTDDSSHDEDDLIEVEDGHNQPINSGCRIPVIISQRKPIVFDYLGRSKPVRKVVKRNNRSLQAIDLPSVMNINPRSIYNKVNEFLTLVEEYDSDLIFMSETWDRATQPLEDLIRIRLQGYHCCKPQKF